MRILSRTEQKGFTLIELVIYIALISVLLLVISQIFIASLDAQTESEAVSSVDQDGRFLLSRLSYDMSRADDVIEPVSFGTPASTLILLINGDTYTYSQNGNQLQVTGPFGTDQLTSSLTRLRSLSFEKLGNTDGLPTIRVHFTLESVTIAETGVKVESFQSTFGLR